MTVRGNIIASLQDLLDYGGNMDHSDRKKLIARTITMLREDEQVLRECYERIEVGAEAQSVVRARKARIRALAR